MYFPFNQKKILNIDQLPFYTTPYHDGIFLFFFFCIYLKKPYTENRNMNFIENRHPVVLTIIERLKMMKQKSVG